MGAAPSFALFLSIECDTRGKGACIKVYTTSWDFLTLSPCTNWMQNHTIKFMHFPFFVRFPSDAYILYGCPLKGGHDNDSAALFTIMLCSVSAVHAWRVTKRERGPEWNCVCVVASFEPSMSFSSSPLHLTALPKFISWSTNRAPHSQLVKHLEGGCGKEGSM